LAAEISLTLSAPESPSLVLALEAHAAANGETLQLKLKIENIPTPDPRLPYQEVRHVLWRLEGEELLPVPAPPSQAIVDRIVALALDVYDLEQNWESAGAFAQEFGAESLPDLLGCMVHPPAMPADHSALQWIFRLQVVAAQFIAQIEGGQAALHDILAGPRDWVTKAAIIALVQRANSDPAPDQSIDLWARFCETLAAAPQLGHCEYYECLLRMARLMNKLPPDLHSELDKRLEQYLDS
jgi:hypothetical protein